MPLRAALEDQAIQLGPVSGSYWLFRTDGLAAHELENPRRAAEILRVVVKQATSPVDAIV
jgi:hypothetical protein